MGRRTVSIIAADIFATIGLEVSRQGSVAPTNVARFAKFRGGLELLDTVVAINHSLSSHETGFMWFGVCFRTRVCHDLGHASRRSAARRTAVPRGGVLT